MSDEQSVDFKYGFLIGTLDNIKHYCKTMPPEKAIKNILEAIDFADSAGMIKK
jgi:hypothetical protein